ncbi:MAG: FAD-dependent oxidoreductase, partial [bacterium]
LDKKISYTVVVLGAAVWSDNKPSPILAARVDKAIDLMKNFNVEKVYFTGSNAPGELSEAEVALNYLKSKNISADKYAFSSLRIQATLMIMGENIGRILETCLTKKINPVDLDYKLIQKSVKFNYL